MKKFLKFSLIISLIVSSLSLNIYAKEFTDVNSSDWYSDAVNFVVDRNVILISTGNRFNPEDDMTLSQLCDGLENSSLANCTYSDILQFCIDIGMINEEIEDISSNTLDKVLSREEAIMILLRFLLPDLYNNIDEESIDISQISIPDISNSNPSYRKCILLSYKYGLIRGVDSSGNVNPIVSFKRAEFCQVLLNCFQILEN